MRKRKEPVRYIIMDDFDAPDPPPEKKTFIEWLHFINNTGKLMDVAKLFVRDQMRPQSDDQNGD